MTSIRNPEALAGTRQQFKIEFELGSKRQISGLLDCAGGEIISTAMSAEDPEPPCGFTTSSFTFK